MKALIIVILVALAAAGGYFAFRPDANKETASPEENSTTSTETPTGKKMAFSQFVKQGGSYKCTVNQYLGEVGGASTQGITYIDKGMIRGEYSTQAQGISINSTFIVRDGYSYTWTSMAPTMGFKSKVVENPEVNANASASGSYSYNSEQVGDYDCQVWTSDPSLFNIPSEVTFREV